MASCANLNEEIMDKIIAYGNLLNVMYGPTTWYDSFFKNAEERFDKKDYVYFFGNNYKSYIKFDYDAEKSLFTICYFPKELNF